MTIIMIMLKILTILIKVDLLGIFSLARARLTPGGEKFATKCCQVTEHQNIIGTQIFSETNTNCSHFYSICFGIGVWPTLDFFEVHSYEPKAREGYTGSAHLY